MLGRFVDGVLQVLAVLKDFARLQLSVESAVDHRPSHLAAEAIGDVGHDGRVHLDFLEQRLPNLEQTVRSIRPEKVKGSDILFLVNQNHFIRRHTTTS